MVKCGVISVIVPVYRVEAYLEECIESILAQTYRELEIILVDDGSPDRCGAICDRYAREDRRIRVIHQPNAGAAAARNAGLRIASGEYITFVDGDDYLEPDACGRMAEAMEAQHGDIVHSGFRLVYQNGAVDCPGADRVCRFTAEAYLRYFLQDWTCALCWNKLFRRSVLEDVFFEEGHLIDDEFFTYQAAMKAGSVLLIPALTCNYRQRASSVMKNPATLERRCMDILEFLETRQTRVIARFPQLKAEYDSYYADYLLRLTTSEMATERTLREIKARLTAFVAAGKAPFWKAGHRKRALRIAALLMTPTKQILRRREEGNKTSEYAFFE